MNDVTQTGDRTTPYEMLLAIDAEMPYAAHDRERFMRLCVARERVAGDCQDVAESVAAFFRALSPTTGAL